MTEKKPNPPHITTFRPGRGAQNAHSALLACNKALMAANDEGELFVGACRALVEGGGYSFAWIALAENDAEKSVRPVAHCGGEGDYLNGANITWADSERGRGPIGRAIRSGAPAFVSDVADDPGFAPWREAALQRGYRSVLALPLLHGDRAFGALNIYAAETGAFESYEIGLLMAAANTLAYGTVALREKLALAESEASLVAQEDHFQAVLENITDCYYRADPEGRIVMINQAGAAIFGYQVEDLLGQCLSDHYIDPDGREKFVAALQDSGGNLTQYEAALRHSDGHAVWVATSARYRLGADGEFLGVEGIVRDITEKHRMEETLRESEARFRDFADASAHWLWEMGPDLRFSYVSESLRKVTGEDPAVFIGKTRRDLIESVGQPPSEVARQHLETLDRHEAFENFVFSRLDSDGGKTLHVAVSGKPIFDSEGFFLGYRGTTRDITVQIEAKERADLEQRRFLGAIESIAQGIALWGPDDRLVVCNEYFRKLAGSVGPLLETGITFEAFLRLSLEHGELPVAEENPEDWIARRIEHHNNPDGAHEVLRGERWHQVREQRLPDGGIIQISADIHDIKVREERLRETHKMEAIGHLTAGVAHEFNNLLMVVLGNLELLERSPAVPGAQKNMVLMAKEGAQRGARLTDQLLAASSRRVLAAEVLNMRAFLEENTQLLRSTLTEKYTIELQADGGLGWIEADPQELRAALVALAINARDAMPQGGRLVLQAANKPVSESESADCGVSAGEYVLISLSDSGSGMAPEVLAHAFDPFFTTKEVGQGTGLGLSAVHGFARQSGGNAKIESAVGKGTTVHVYLPRVAGSAAEQVAEAEQNEERRRMARILVVEDEPNVRCLLVSQLDSLGYSTLEAENGTAALEILKSDEPIELLLTDVVMPGGLNGVDLAREARSLRPGLRVIFSSGYSQDALALGERLGNGEVLLKKPYYRDVLASTVREMLGNGG